MINSRRRMIPRPRVPIKPTPVLEQANQVILDSAPHLERIASRQQMYAGGGKVGAVKKATERMKGPNHPEVLGFMHTLLDDKLKSLDDQFENGDISESAYNKALAEVEKHRQSLRKATPKFAEGGRVGAFKKALSKSTVPKLSKAQLHFEDLKALEGITDRLAEVAKFSGIPVTDMKVVKLTKKPAGGFVVTVRGPTKSISKIKSEGVTDDMSDDDLAKLAVDQSQDYAEGGKVGALKKTG